MQEIKRRKGIAFTIDAILAFLIILAIVPIFLLLTAHNFAGQNSAQYIHLQAEDAVDVLSKMQVRYVRNEYVVNRLYTRGFLTDADLNDSMLDVLGMLWSSGTVADLADAANITKQLLGPLVPPGLKWSFSIEGDLIYNSTELNNSLMVSASRKSASGFARNQNLSGFVTRAFLENILGREDSAYFFFGGFVGEGNITATISNIPANSNITKYYLEVNSGGNFSLFVNGQFCQNMTATIGGFAVNNWTITDPACRSYYVPGEANNFTFAFSTNNITTQYFGGGYLKVNYNTNELLSQSPGVVRYRFPGINGLVNLYDSLYVPGNVTSMHALVRIYADMNYTTLLYVGNTTILNHTNNNQTEDIILNNTDFAALFAANNITYVDLSQSTMPLRMLVGANITGGKINGTVDIVLITDVSGSMNERIDGVAGGCQNRACNSPQLDNGDTCKYSLAKCLDIDFINAILGGNASTCTGGTPLVGNKVALINFSTNMIFNTSLLGLSNITYLTNVINNYGASGSTCIACAINRAYDILKGQSTPQRQKYVVVMTDGEANYRATNTCSDTYAVDAKNAQASFVGGNLNSQMAGADGSWLWGPLTAPTTNIMRSISIYNSTLGYAVGNGGTIYKWDGTSWSSVSSPVAENLYGVKILNDSFGFAVGDAGRILLLNSSGWSLVPQPSNTNLRAVDIYNGTLAFAVNTSGGVLQWNGASWSVSGRPTTGALYGVKFVNGTLAFAVGASGKIDYWNGASWAEYATTGTQQWNGIDVNSQTLAFVVGNTGAIYRWNGASWSSSTSSTTANLQGVSFVNSTLAYAVTTNGNAGNALLFSWSGGASWSIDKTKVKYAYAGNLTNGMGCSDSYVETLYMNQSYSALNANYSAGRIAGEMTNHTIDTIGFGLSGTSRLGNTTLIEIANTGNGTFYTSSNASYLRSVYCQIAQNINTKSTPTQEITFSGNITYAKLYPESYIEFAYTPASPDPDYKEISASIETDPFPNCNGTFFIPQLSRIIDAKATSYSGNFWTKRMYLNSSNTGGVFRGVFNMSVFGFPYTDLGDPFYVYLPIANLSMNANNSVRDELGLNDTYSYPSCSSFNKVIYTARLRASTNFSSIFPTSTSKTVQVWYDNNHDGVADGYVNITFGGNVTGPAVNVSSLANCTDAFGNPNPNGDAMDCAILTLLAQLNYVIVPSNSGPAGSQTNPIDLILGGEVGVSTDTMSMVPIPWGPAQMSVSMWV